MVSLNYIYIDAFDPLHLVKPIARKGKRHVICQVGYRKDDLVSPFRPPHVMGGKTVLPISLFAKNDDDKRADYGYFPA
jgi:hypothetical protein